ncbi:MAG TPA: DUF721 domain-containing protein [Bacteroidota bacterium]|nr:DUF721 domain-containing protein [Bacteroidota bacterium]
MGESKSYHRTRTAEGASRQPEPFAHALDLLVRRLGITKKMKEFSVVTAWPKIVGEQISKVTEAERIENGILFVRAATAPWRTELTMRREEIRKLVNAAAGSEIVKEIRFR